MKQQFSDAPHPALRFLCLLKRWLSNPRIVFVIWIVAAFLSAFNRAQHGTFNNFLVFCGGFHHLIESLPLYAAYPDEYFDLYHYGPPFAFIIAPFTLLPPAAGSVVWVVAMAALLFWTVRRLPVSVPMQCVILFLMINDLFAAGRMQQFNIAVAALLIGSLTLIRERREGWAALFIVIGTLTKVYGIVGLAFFFFVQRKWRFVGYMALWTAVALLLPLLFVSPEYLFSQYTAWIVDLTQKNAQNMFCDYTNISLLGTVRKISGSTSYSDLWLMVPAVVMFLISYLRFRQFGCRYFQMTMLASLLLFIVLFSSGSELSGYVIAAAGAGVWWASLSRRGALEWTLLVLVLLASYSHQLFPREVYKPYIVGYALCAVPYFLVWLHCIFRMWFCDFRTDDKMNSGCGNLG